MRTLLLLAGVFMAVLAAAPVTAGNLSQPLANRLTGCWDKLPKNADVSRALCFDGKWTVETSWIGSDGSGGLEGLSSGGRYQLLGGLLALHETELADGWLWDWTDVACRAAIAGDTLTLSRCVGTGRRIGDELPGWHAIDDMSFAWSGKP